jgi:CBS domain-containing protein
MDQVRDLMTHDPVRITEDEPLATCARRMRDHRVRHLVVTDADGRLKGILTDMAVHRRGVLVGNPPRLWWPDRAAGPEDAVARDAMDPAVSVLDSDPLVQAVTRMAAGRLDVIVAVDDQDRPIGILTEHDGVRLALAMVPTHLETRFVRPPVVYTATLDETAAAVLARITERRVRHMVLVDDDGLLSGVVSIRDLRSISDDRLARPVAELRHPGGTYHLPETATLLDAARMMVRHRIGCVPVIDHGRPLRIVTRRDVLDGLRVALEEEDLFQGLPVGQEPGGND